MISVCFRKCCKVNLKLCVGEERIRETDTPYSDCYERKQMKIFDIKRHTLEVTLHVHLSKNPNIQALFMRLVLNISSQIPPFFSFE